MKITTVLSAIIASVSLSVFAPAATASAAPPDPTPGGPQRPYEPDVEGTENVDSLSVTATRGAGRSVTIAFDRRSRAATGTVPAGARRFVFLFDPSVSFNPGAFPTCARTVIERQGVRACPEGSRVGGGLGQTADGLSQEVLAFNTKVGRLPGVLVVLPASGVILEQTFERVSPRTAATTGGRWTRSSRPRTCRRRSARAPPASSSPSAPPGSTRAAPSASPRPAPSPVTR
ncbi:hypothetical protein ACFQYP_15600 [Nonomuraea antimicrobica]